MTAGGASQRWSTERPTGAQSKSLARFWAKVDKSAECWNWTGIRDKDGYGKHRPGVGLLYMRTHRFSWMIANGDIPEGAHVLHRCDNRRCVRPDHLFLGDNRANIDDMVAKGRSIRGEKNYRARLNAAQVIEIRKRVNGGDFIRAIAREYGVTKACVQALVHGRTWKHIPLEPPHDQEAG